MTSSSELAGGNGRPRPPGEPGGGDARRRSPWVIAIVVGLILVALVNVLFICIAVRGQDPVVDSYNTQTR